ncbi:MAG: anti-sigma factor family protein [Planctomycetota bacterium]
MSTMPPAGAESPVVVTFPDGTTATFDQLRDLLDEFHDGELDAAAQEKVKFALEHCPRLAQESSVIIGISRLLKNYEGPQHPAVVGAMSDDQLSSRILGRVKVEPPPERPAGFPWGAVVIGLLVLLVAGSIGIYIFEINARPAANVDFAPHEGRAPAGNRQGILQGLKISAVIAASSPTVNVLRGKVVLFSPGEMSRDLKSGDQVHMADGQRLELTPDSLVILTGEGKGTLKIEHTQEHIDPTIEYQAGRLPVVTSVTPPTFMATQQAPFAYTWRSALAKTDQNFVFLPELDEKTYPSRCFEYTGALYPESGAPPTGDHFVEKVVRWLTKSE